eukprot:COSAG04_NODE_8176_length_1011_cov_1.484649_3_plen_73_part_00
MKRKDFIQLYIALGASVSQSSSCCLSQSRYPIATTSIIGAQLPAASGGSVQLAAMVSEQLQCIPGAVDAIDF